MMKYFRNHDGLVFGYDEADQVELISEAMERRWQEVTGSWPPPQDPADIIKAQINTIEATVTQRRMREATLGIDNGWLAEIDAQIAMLRAQL